MICNYSGIVPKVFKPFSLEKNKMGPSFLKKKKEKEEHLPPPPPISPNEGLVGDIEPIRPRYDEAPEPSQVPNLAIPEISMEEESVEEAEEAPIPPKFPREFEEPIPEEFEAEEKEEVKGPVFVSVGDYEKIELDINSIRTLLNEAEDNLKVLNETIESEDKLFEKWRSFLEGVEKKLVFVDKIIKKTGE